MGRRKGVVIQRQHNRKFPQNRPVELPGSGGWGWEYPAAWVGHLRVMTQVAPGRWEEEGVEDWHKNCPSYLRALRPGVWRWPIIQQPQSSAIEQHEGWAQGAGARHWVVGAHHPQFSPGRAGPWVPGSAQEQSANPRGPGAGWGVSLPWAGAWKLWGTSIVDGERVLGSPPSPSGLHRALPRSIQTESGITIHDKEITSLTTYSSYPQECS